MSTWEKHLTETRKAKFEYVDWDYEPKYLTLVAFEDEDGYETFHGTEMPAEFLRAWARAKVEVTRLEDVFHTVVREARAKAARYTVWVGGVEVNDYLLTEEEADNTVATYLEYGYTDAIKKEVTE